MAEQREWMGLKEAARRLGYADSSVLRWRIKNGRIPSSVLIRIGNAWGISRGWIEYVEYTRPGQDLDLEEDEGDDLDDRR